MPSVRQGGGYTLTFSKKNKDVEQILADKKENGIIITDYICNAIRAYENNNSESNINIVDIEKIVQKQVALALNKNNEIPKQIVLEDDLDDIDIDDD